MNSEPPERDAGRLPFVRDRLGYALLGTLAVAVLVVLAVRNGLVTIPAGTTETAHSLLERYGLVALLGVFVVEGAMLLYFAPSESLVPAAVLVLADSTGEIAAIVGVAVVGATIGQTALFVLAKRGGREILTENRWLSVDEGSLDRFAAWFDRWGAVVVPVSNTLLFTRGMVTIPAGLAGMDTRAFVALSALGTLAFESLLAVLTVYGADLLAAV
jgi:membrane protein DedA with SNARE-associated domain